MEVHSLWLNVTIQRSSIQIRSNQNDAYQLAVKAAAHGIVQQAIKLKEDPARPAIASIGSNGGVTSTQIPYSGDGSFAPPDNPEDSYCPDTILDQLEGSIMEISCPFLTNNQVLDFTSNIANEISSSVSTTAARTSSNTYVGGGHTIYPGQKLGSEIVHTVEFTYSDKDSQTVTITTGPKFYQPGSAGNDSTYIKRSENLQKIGVVTGGSAEEGRYAVTIDGLGSFDALNGIIDSVHIGDSVDVKIINYPVER